MHHTILKRRYAAGKGIVGDEALHTPSRHYAYC